VPPSTCEEAVARRLAEIDDLRSAAYGDPIPFPDDLEWTLQPEAVEARARRVMAECPELGWTLHEVDCSEYPCITFWDHAEKEGERVQLDDCPAWSEVRTQGEAMRASLFWEPDGTQREIIAVAQFSPRSEDTWQTVPEGGRASRFEVRTQPILDDLEQVIRAK
jgi:hypothetical protein